MRVIDPGHEYELTALDGGGPQRLVFVKRVGPNYPGNGDARPGLLTQEVIRALIDRCLYMNNQGSCVETDGIIADLRSALYRFEVRAARCRGHAIELPTIDGIERIPTCPKCGHIQCDFSRHAKPHWSDGKGAPDTHLRSAATSGKGE
jgi:hypothetical protein